MTAQILPSSVTSSLHQRVETSAQVSCGSEFVYPSSSSAASASARGPFHLKEDSNTFSTSEISFDSVSAQPSNGIRSSPADNTFPSCYQDSWQRQFADGNGIHQEIPQQPPRFREKLGWHALRPVYAHLRSETDAGPAPSIVSTKHRVSTGLRNQEKRAYRIYDGVHAVAGVQSKLTSNSSEEFCPRDSWVSATVYPRPRGQGSDWRTAAWSPQELPGVPMLSNGSNLTPNGEAFARSHSRRKSTSSSRFVRTMKTASVSNMSFSLAPRSLRFGRSADHSLTFSSAKRNSIDSERPPTSASVDEAAFRRAIKRRQILLELVSTEESYISDLKALVYLYSTLLATSVSVSNRVRSSILKNIHDLLALHEKLLDRLHQASYNAAARRWADTTSPPHLGLPRYHKRWKSLGSSTAAKFGRNHRRTRTSTESSELSRGHTYLGGAEPRDVADVAAIFRELLNEFLLYEEYCANHGLISQELQRRAPAHWSTYESGMESLARSLVALDQKTQNARKGLTVGDLLIKPIQRMTKYPLLFDDILKHTPVADCPITHTDIDAILTCLKDVVQTVNKATDSRETRDQIQRRWSLQTRLTFDMVSLKAEHFRMLGNVQLCGVLHATWQNRANRVDGRYALCVLFDRSLIIAVPTGATSKFEIIAFLHLSDVKVDSASDGRGLQCPSALHTWKICFETRGHLHELVLSACSSTEEHVWKAGMRNREAPSRRTDELFHQIPSSTGLDLRSIGQVYSQQSSTLSRNPSVQRAATVGNRAPVCQVIIRNTHNPEDLAEFRQPSASAINRSQSHMTSNRVVVIAPKRSERARLETALGDVWTKEKLPFPGIVGSRGGQIIRASAGSLVRKLSLASLQAPFSRRSRSVSLASRKSFDVSTDSHGSRMKHSTPVFEVRKDSLDEAQNSGTKPREIPEVDTMDTVISRMIGASMGRKLSNSHDWPAISISERVGRRHKSGQYAEKDLRPEDPAEVFYSDEREMPEAREIVEEGLAGKKKRWSKPLEILKVLSGDGLRNMLYSSR
jgi:hypothetical protein